MLGQVFLGWTSTKQQIESLAHGHNTCDSVGDECFDSQSNTLPSEPMHSTHNKSCLLSHLLMYFSSLHVYCKQYEPWSDSSSGAVWPGFIVFAPMAEEFYSALE